MQNDIELIKSISFLLWPIILLIIVYMFRKEIRVLLLSLVSNKNEIKTGDYKPAESHIPDPIPLETDRFPPPGTNEIKSNTQLKVTACRNINTNNLFILLAENHNKIYCITPDGEIKWLDKGLFLDCEDVDADFFETEQLEKFYWWIQNSELNQPILGNNERIAISGYLPSYMRMLDNPDTEPSRMLRYIKSRNESSWSEIRIYLNNKYGYSIQSGSMGASLKALEVLGHVRIVGQGDNKRIR